MTPRRKPRFWVAKPTIEQDFHSVPDKWRAQKGWSLAKLARLAGLDRGTVTEVVTRYVQPSSGKITSCRTDTATKLAAALGYDKPADLFDPANDDAHLQSQERAHEYAELLLGLELRPGVLDGDVMLELVNLLRSMTPEELRWGQGVFLHKKEVRAAELGEERG